MSQTTIGTMGVAAAVITLGLFVTAAVAQQPAPAAKSPPPSPAITAAKPAAKAVPKVVSPCGKLLEPACKGKADCSWVVPTKVNVKTGKVPAAYCRTKSTHKMADKAPAAKPAAPKKSPGPAVPK